MGNVLKLSPTTVLEHLVHCHDITDEQHQGSHKVDGHRRGNKNPDGNKGGKQKLAKPDPMRLEYRNLIKQVIYQVITHPENDPEDEIRKGLNTELENLTSLIIEELRRLHEGVLARYGLRASQFKSWKNKQYPKL
jgi:hypothetical protein